MKNSKIFYLLITLLVVSCNSTEDVEVMYDNEIIEQEESSTEQSTQVVKEKLTEVLVTTETLELDRKYRDDSNFILPTFNGMVKTKIIYDDKTFESENALLSIERSRNGIYLLTLNGTVVKIDNS